MNLNCIAKVVLTVTTTLVISSNALKLVHFSDIHLDPFYGTPQAVGPCTTNASSLYGTPNCDSPPFLVASALQEVAARSQLTNDPHIVVFTGDWVRHGTQQLQPRPMDEMVTIFTEGTKIISENLLGVPTFIPVFGFALGNEDFYPDYNATLDNPILKPYAESLVSSGLLSQDQAATMGTCGYYSVAIEAAPITIIVWNTVLYNSRSTLDSKDPCGQFAWMESQLQSARSAGRAVFTVAHIGPILLQWRADYATTWEGILSQYTDVVRAQLYGHIHATTLAAISGMEGVPMLVSGGITQISKTNSAFQIYELDPQSLQVTGWEQVSLTPPSAGVAVPGTNNSAWSRTVDVKQLLGLNAITFDAMNSFATAMRSNATLFTAYLSVLGDGVVEEWMSSRCSGELMGPLCQKGASCIVTQNSVDGIVGCVLEGLHITDFEASQKVAQFAIDLASIVGRN